MPGWDRKQGTEFKKCLEGGITDLTHWSGTEGAGKERGKTAPLVSHLGSGVVGEIYREGIQGERSLRCGMERQGQEGEE